MRWLERLALGLYGLAMRLARPLLKRKLKRRAQQEPGYAHAVAARFGRYAPEDAPAARGRLLWIHAVSLGETRAAAVLIEALRRRLPGLRLLLTHGTATGWAQGQRWLCPGDVQTWLPWDDPWSMRRFLQHHRPTVGVLMETEVWPVLLHEATRAGVPLVLANARLNVRSMRAAQRLAWLARPAYGALALVGAQTPEDAQRLQAVGAPAPQVWGNLKYDAQPDAAQQASGRRWRAALGRPVVMLASSREGEERQFLEALDAFPLDWKALAATKKIIFLVVPRHPQRFEEVAALLAQRGEPVWRRAAWGERLAQSVGASVGLPAEVPRFWLGDSLGEMALYASLADVALLGGSFAPLGGQNLIELAACGCTVVAGPHTFNFADATERAVEAGVAVRVPDVAAGLQAALALIQRHDADPAADASAREAAMAWARSQQGATARAVAAIEQLWLKAQAREGSGA